MVLEIIHHIQSVASFSVGQSFVASCKRRLKFPSKTGWHFKTLGEVLEVLEEKMVEDKDLPSYPTTHKSCCSSIVNEVLLCGAAERNICLRSPRLGK